MTEKIKYSHVQFQGGKSFFFDHVRIFWNEQIAFHQQREWEITYIVRGSGTRLIGDVIEPFSSGEVVLLPPHLPHGWLFNEFDHDEDGKIENITLIFPESLLDGIGKLFPEMEGVVFQLRKYNKAISFEGSVLGDLQLMMTQMVTKNDQQQLSSLINIISKIADSTHSRVVGYCEKNTKSAYKVREIYRYILHNFQNNITLENVSKFAGMNRASFCTFYKRETGKTFITALNEYRIKCSCLMLRETNKSIAEICYAVGFNDVPHFSRTFRKIIGKSARSYREHKSLRLGYD